MEVFWSKGYAETSVRDRVTHAGGAHAGLYSAFGDKRSLYKETLRHYDQTIGDMLLVPLEKPEAGRKEIEAMFATVLGAAKSGAFVNGCFMVNTAVELGNDAHDVLSSTRKNMERMARSIEGALNNALSRREVREDLDANAAAKHLVTTFYGVAVLARAKTPQSLLEQSIDYALSQLD